MVHLMGEVIVNMCCVVHRRQFTFAKNFSETAWSVKALALGRGNESLLAASGSHDQDGPPCLYTVKTLQKSPEPGVTVFQETGNWYLL